MKVSGRAESLRCVQAKLAASAAAARSRLLTAKSTVCGGGWRRGREGGKRRDAHVAVRLLSDVASDSGELRKNEEVRTGSVRGGRWPLVNLRLR